MNGGGLLEGDQDGPIWTKWADIITFDGTSSASLSTKRNTQWTSGNRTPHFEQRVRLHAKEEGNDEEDSLNDEDISAIFDTSTSSVPLAQKFDKLSPFAMSKEVYLSSWKNTSLHLETTCGGDRDMTHTAGPGDRGTPGASWDAYVMAGLAESMEWTSRKAD